MNLKAMLKGIKAGIMCPPQIKDNGDLTGNTYFDCQGLSAVLVLIITGTIDAALGSTAEGTAVKLEECDTSGGTYADISGAALADAIAATEDDSIFGIFVDRTNGARKRYLQVNTPHAGDGTNGVTAAIIAIGFPADQFPDGATAMGLAEFIEA